MKNALLTALAMAAFTNTAIANDLTDNVQLTDCVIYVHNPSTNDCTGAVNTSADLAAREKNNMWFKDHAWDANVVAGRCVERAREFLGWCGGDYAFSVFRVQGHNVIGGSANDKGYEHLSDGGSRWLKYHHQN